MAHASYVLRSIWFSFEQLETRLCLSTLLFAGHEIDNGARSSQTFVVDVDSDGDVDVLSGRAGSDIAWYENTDGRGRFSKANVIGTHAVGPLMVQGRWLYGADLDADDDIDVLSVSMPRTPSSQQSVVDAGLI